MTPRELSKSKAREIHSLGMKKNREKLKLFLAEGEKCVLDMLGSFVLENLVCTKDWLSRHIHIKDLYGDSILLIPDNDLLNTVSTLSTPSEVVAVFQMPSENKDIIRLNPTKLYLALDGIQDPGNLGTIIRTCDWFGVYDIFASKETVDVYNPKVVQATMGSLSRVKVTYTDLATLIKKNDNLRIYGTLLNGTPLKDYNDFYAGLLIMGNEGKGISGQIKDLITDAITIEPQNKNEHPDSLNVAIATGVVLSYIRINQSH